MSLDFPTIYLLPTHIDPNALPELESKIPTLTSDINDASIILANISNRERAKFELRRRKIFTEDIHSLPNPVNPRKISSSASSLSAHETRAIAGCGDDENKDNDSHDGESIITVVKLPWFADCLALGSILPVNEYLIYQGRKTQQAAAKTPPDSHDILKRAQQEGESDQRTSKVGSPHASGSASLSQHARTSARIKRPALGHESTSEHERRADMPPIPDYLHTTYSCQRPTPSDPLNAPFIEELKKVRTLRTLEGDNVGIRAYSTGIASLAAYPYLISQPAEVARLPGCGEKFAALYQQWTANGYLDEVKDAETDPKMSVLQLFYNIWGVAATTAQDYYNKGWRDLDDIIEYGWDDLNRVQQIGLKYYDELQEKIPRHEVGEVGQVILKHANKIRQGFQMVIVGGYRRGKTESGDVDVILSHPDTTLTSNFVAEIVSGLESEKYITHTLIMSTKNSERGQTPVAWKGQNVKAGGGFDTLDKALVVWQSPDWDKAKSSKNPNPHRRVDIIISPWKTAGCAVVGWTGGTTFQRDLRRYCKHMKRLKFDSSGVRSRTDGSWVDLESDSDGPAPDMLTAEKRIFRRLGLEWRSPEERCTG
ncbi:Nucleotidyltransferase [Hypoxylon sp. NC1633]|nr:Nucleotidyltransferase [Hypoxylon sp. NC1633]